METPLVRYAMSPLLLFPNNYRYLSMLDLITCIGHHRPRCNQKVLLLLTDPVCDMLQVTHSLMQTILDKQVVQRI